MKRNSKTIERDKEMARAGQKAGALMKLIVSRGSTGEIALLLCDYWNGDVLSDRVFTDVNIPDTKVKELFAGHIDKLIWDGTGLKG